MTWLRWTSVAGAALLAAAALGACGDEGVGGSGGTAGTGGTGATGGSTTSSSSSSSSTGTVMLEPSGYSCSPTAPSLGKDVVPITSANCSTATCHLAMASGTGVRDQLVNRIAEECTDLRLMIKPGDPEHSYVIHKLSGHNLCNPATTMPLNTSPLSSAEIQTIYDWICQGAPDN